MALHAGKLAEICKANLEKEELLSGHITRLREENRLLRRQLDEKENNPANELSSDNALLAGEINRLEQELAVAQKEIIYLKAELNNLYLSPHMAEEEVQASSSAAAN